MWDNTAHMMFIWSVCGNTESSNFNPIQSINHVTAVSVREREDQQLLPQFFAHFAQMWTA